MRDTFKRWRVIVTADATVSASVEVSAFSVEEAEDMARELANSSPEKLSWSLDDNAPNDAYIADPGNSAEEI